MLGHIVNAPALGHGGLGLDHEHPPRGEGICGRGLGEGRGLWCAMSWQRLARTRPCEVATDGKWDHAGVAEG